MKPYAPTLIVTADCHGCGVCVPVCSSGAISMCAGGEAGERAAPAAEIDAALCDMCRECLDVCPVEAICEPYPPGWREYP